MSIIDHLLKYLICQTQKTTHKISNYNFHHKLFLKYLLKHYIYLFISEFKNEIFNISNIEHNTLNTIRY